MAKLLLLVTLVTMILVVNGGKVDFRNFLNRLSERKNPPPSAQPAEDDYITEGWVTQRLDNFNPASNVTWEQRYLTNRYYYQNGGCIFIFLSGGWMVTTDRLEYSLMLEMSRENNCYMFYLEHRFYGESRPTSDISDENLRWLTPEQALADTAHFVEHIKTESVVPGAANAPIIVIGSHYSGSLAVWFRQSYPHLTVGAWASSAPTLAIVDHFEYKEVAGAVYRHVGGNQCYERLERGFAAMEQLIEDGRSDELTDMFQVCGGLREGPDTQIFFSLVSELYALLAQYDDFPQFDEIVNIAAVCEIILNETLSDVEAVASIIPVLLEDECIEIDYDLVIEADRQTSWDAPAVVAGFRQYTYVACTQLGWYHSSTSVFQPFGSSFPVDFIYQACEDVFDELYSVDLMHDNVNRLNTRFGALQPDATNIIYVHGQFDPWRTIGVQADRGGEGVTVIIIEGASQSVDLDPIEIDDTQVVVEAKERIKQIIGDWITGAQQSA